MTARHEQPFEAEFSPRPRRPCSRRRSHRSGSSCATNMGPTRAPTRAPTRTSRPNLLATSQWLGQLAALYPKGRRTSGSELLRASNWLQKTEEAPPVGPITRSPQPRAPAEVTPARGRPCSTDGGIRGRGHAVAHAEGVGRANGPPRGCSLHRAFHHVRPCSELAPQTGRSLVCTMCPQNAAATLCVTLAVYLSLPVPFDALSKRRKCSVSLRVPTLRRLYPAPGHTWKCLEACVAVLAREMCP